jgi:hypothetical protein
MGGQVRLFGVELAPVTRAYKLDGIRHGRWPVKALPKSVSYKGPWGGVVATSPRVQVVEEFSTFLYGDATL